MSTLAELDPVAARPAAATRSAGEFLSFQLGAEEYVIDILKVQEIRSYETPTRIADAPAFVRGVVNLRGTIVPLVDLRQRFGLDDTTYDDLTVVIVLNLGTQVIGIVVDSVSDVVRPAAEDIKPAPAFAGAVDADVVDGIACLEDRLLIMLNVERLLGSPALGLF